MSYTAIAISGFTAGLGFASVVASLMVGYYAASKSLAEV